MEDSNYRWEVMLGNPRYWALLVLVIFIISGSSAKVIYQEDFDDGSAQNWNIQTGDADSGVTSSPTCTGDSPANCPETEDGYLLQTDSTDVQTSPAININGYQNVYLRFFLGSESMDNSSENTQVDVSQNGGNSWTTVKEIHNKPSSGTEMPYFTIDVTQYQSPNFKLRLDNVGGNGVGDHGFIDEVTVTTGSSLSFASNSGPPSGSAWIESNSLWWAAEGKEYNMEPAPHYKTVYSEDFDDGSAQNWNIQQSECSGGTGVLNSSSCTGDTSAICPAPYNSHILETSGDNTLTSPTIDLSSYSKARIGFSMASESMDSSSEDTILQVYDGSSWVEVKRIHNTPTSGTYPNDYSIDVDSYINSNFKFRIYNSDINGCGDHGFLDEVKVYAAGKSNGPKGAWWIEDSLMHWIDSGDIERSIRGKDTGNNPSGPKGSVWIENGLIHYIDSSGDERKLSQLVTKKIDDFEDSDWSEYSGDTGNFSFTNNSYEGSYAGLSAQSSNAYEIYSTSGLNTYPSAGDVFTQRVYNKADDGSFALRFGVQDSSNYYSAIYQSWTNDVEIRVVSGGSATTKQISQNLPTDEWMKWEINWGDSGQITWTIYNSSGTKINSISITDTNYTSGGIGYQSYADDVGGYRFDNLKIK